MNFYMFRRYSGCIPIMNTAGPSLGTEVRFSNCKCAVFLTRNRTHANYCARAATLAHFVQKKSTLLKIVKIINFKKPHAHF